MKFATREVDIDAVMAGTDTVGDLKISERVRVAQAIRQRIEELSGRRVYFAQAGKSGPIKIGVAVNVTKRIAQLQVGCADQLRLLGVACGGHIEEQRLHKAFAADRLRGEWFRPSDALLTHIATLEAA